MIGAALIIIVTKKVSLSASLLFIAFFASVGISIQYLGNYHYFAGTQLDILFNNYEMHRNALFFCYPFFYIGFLINKYKTAEKISINLAVSMLGGGLIILILESYFNYIQITREGGFDNYISLFLLCPFILILFLKINIKGKTKNIALLSSGVYFLHAFFLSFLGKFMELSSIATTLICIVITLAVSLCIIKISPKYKYIL